MAETEMQFADPRAIHEFSGNFPLVPFPVPGEYRLQLFANDHDLIIERRVLAIQLSQDHDHE